MLSKNQIAMLIIVGSSLTSACVFAETDSPTSIAPGYAVPRTVDQMLSIDAQRALMNEQRLLLEEQRKGGFGRLSSTPENRIEPAEVKPKEAPKPSEIPVQIDLLGIFGIGSVLQADVEINGNRYRYKRGYELPVGVGNDFRYRLVSINTPCISLSDTNGTPRKICLSRTSL